MGLSEREKPGFKIEVDDMSNSSKELLAKLAGAGVLVDGQYSATKYRFCDAGLKAEVRAKFADNPSLSGARFAELVYWLYHGLSTYPKWCAECKTKPITHFHSFPSVTSATIAYKTGLFRSIPYRGGEHGSAWLWKCWDCGQRVYGVRRF
jgi:hypothetical protein